MSAVMSLHVVKKNNTQQSADLISEIIGHSNSCRRGNKHPSLHALSSVIA